jgi:hypothetical protein
VERDSALKFYPHEERTPVQANHSDLVKFGTAIERPYRTVVRQLTQCLGKVGKDEFTYVKEYTRT